MWNNNIIAISGKSGCGNSTVSALVAKELGFKHVNYTFHNMAEEAGMKFEDFCMKAEKDPSIDKALDKKQKDLALAGNCVLGSRLAVWLLKKEATLTVYLTASENERAKRIHKREGGNLKKVKADMEARDKRDNHRFKRLYNIDNNDYGFVHLLIDSEDKSAEQVAAIIVSEFRERTAIHS